MFFNKGSQFPVSGFYPILFDIPIIGWMFRIPSKFAMILALTYTMLVSFGLYGLISYRALRFREPVIYSLFLAMLICITIIGWPMFTGDFGGIYQDKKYLPRLDNPTSNLHLVFTPPEQNFAVIGGLHQLDLLKEYPAVDINNQSSIIFLDQALSTPYDTTVMNNLIINDKDSMMMHFIPNDSIVLSPFDSTKRYSPNAVWSRAQTNYATVNGSFPTYLTRYSIHTSDLDYGRGIVFTQGHDRLPLPFNIIHTGNYELFVRYLESKAGGTINVGFDEKPTYSLNTLGTSDGFSWKNIGNFHLPAGHHVISIESVRGFNAVSLLMLIPSEAVQNQDQQVDNLLKSSRTIQVLGSDDFIPVMSPRGAEEIIPTINGSTNRNLTGEFDVPDGTFDGIVRSSSNKLSNVHVSILSPNAEFRTHIEPMTSSNYILSFLVKTCNACTTLKVRIGDSFHELPLRSNDTNFKWFNIREYLSADGADISISSSNRVEFGGLIIYSLPNDPSGSRTSAESPLLKIDLDKAEINPTKYKVKANFSVPFILKFEKPFNSSWRANVNGHEYRSVQIFAEESPISDPTLNREYPAVNGFLIDKTGQLDITIEYTPHEWFQIGLVCSLATLGLSLIYLAWQKWKKGKKIKRVEKPRAGSSMKIAPISTDVTERIGGKLTIRDNQIVLICALILLLSLPFLIALHQDSNIISNVMALTYVLLIVAGISLFTSLILQKPASDSVNAVKRSPASADKP
jgi:hypothetical protein